jgi:hypothetical protein
VSKEETEVIRDFLITIVTLENGGRASLISGLTVPLFNGARYIAKKDIYTVHIVSHKTSSSVGAAFLQMDEDRKKQMEGYLHVIR